MKNIYLILFLFVSTIYCQKGYSGLKLQFGASDKIASSIGAGLNYTTIFNNMSHVRLLFEASYNNFRRPPAKREPFVAIIYYGIISVKLQYLHYLGSMFYTGAGIGYFNYMTGTNHGSEFDGYYYREQEIGNSFGADFLIGINLGEIALELDYVFSSPDLASSRSSSDSVEGFSTETEKANLNMFYLNFIYIFHFVE